MRTKPWKWTEALISIVLAELIGALSALITGSSFRSTYEQMQQPPFAPPALVFPIVWGILYAIMGITAYQVFLVEEHCSQKTRALWTYGLQLIVNGSWSIVFFKLQQMGAAIGVLALLLALVVSMIIQFWKLRKWAGILNIPYLLWCCFAMYLNIGFYFLN